MDLLMTWIISIAVFIVKSCKTSVVRAFIRLITSLRASVVILSPCSASKTSICCHTFMSTFVVQFTVIFDQMIAREDCRQELAVRQDMSTQLKANSSCWGWLSTGGEHVSE